MAKMDANALRSDILNEAEAADPALGTDPEKIRAAMLDADAKAASAGAA
jgi:hypothetical protein